MAKENIKLSKKIIINKLSNKLHTKSFNDLTRSSNPINEEKINDLYKSLFYSISKKGSKSHESIIIESRDYLYPQINKKLDNQIEELVEETNILDNKLLKLKRAPQANTEYPNGSFITAGNSTGQFDGMPTVYIMQEGMKRAFASEGFYKIARKAFNVPGELYSELYMLSVDELNQIPDGLTINLQQRFSDVEFAADYGEIYQRSPFDSISLTCEGREAADTFDLVEGDFWLDDDPDDACTVTYVKNMFLGDEEEPSIEIETIGVGKTKVLEFAKDGDGFVGIPKKIKDQYDDYYDYDKDIQKSGTRLWGKDNKYKGILLAEGRILMEGKKFNTKTNKEIIADKSFDEMFGNVRRIYSHGCKQMDGTYDDCFGDLNQKGNLAKLFDNPDFRYYNKTVTFNKNHVNDSVGNNESAYLHLGDNGYFSNRHRATLRHFDQLKGKTFSVYGQPILRLSGKYAIYLKSAITEVPKLRYHYFYNLEATKSKELIFKINDEDIESYLFNKDNESYKKQSNTIKIALARAAMGTRWISDYQYSHGMIGKSNTKRFNWEAVDVNKVHFIGLTHEPIKNKKINLTGYNPNGGNYFNPLEEGSNYSVSEEVSNLINPEEEVSVSNFCNYTRAQLLQFRVLSFGSPLPQGCTLKNCLDC